MRVFLDTSVLVAAFYGDHPAHEACLDVFRRCSRASACCAVHSLAELYAVMTRLPVRPAITPEHCLLFLSEIQERLAGIGLTEKEYYRVIEQAAEHSLTGGAIYDRLILECAQKCSADVVYTLNKKHFAALAPALAARIKAP